MQDTDSKRLSMEEDKREYVPYKSKYSLTIKNDKLKGKKGTKQLTMAQDSIDTMRNSSYPGDRES